MKINEAVHKYSKLLDRINNDYKISYIEAQTIIMHALNITKIKLISEGLKELNDNEINNIEILINRRLQYEPLAYLINKKEFYGLNFYVDNNVLIPRPETEEIIDLVLNYSKEKDNLSICDIGAGSGNISITLKKIFDDLNKSIEITAIDISNNALEVLKINYANILKSSINIINADALLFEPEKKFDIIVSNAPYVPLKDKSKLQKDLEFEPQNALYSGYDGLDFYRNFINIIDKYLKESGAFFFEIGYDQGEKLMNICEQLGIKNVSIKKDFNNMDRFLVCSYFNRAS